MKKFILGFIFFNLSTNLIFTMEERPGENKLPQISDIFLKLDPELQIHTIEQGIQARLNSHVNPIDAFLEAFTYLNHATATNKFLYSKKPELIKALKQMAQEKFASEYKDWSKEELNEKLKEIIKKLLRSRDEIYDNTEVKEFFKNISKTQNYALNEIAKLILAGANPNYMIRRFKIGSYQPLLSHIIYFGDINLIRLLIAYDAKLNLLAENGLTLLMGAIIDLDNLGVEKTKQIIELLIKRGAQVNEKTAAETALFQAFQSDNPEIIEIIKVLLEHGAKPDKEAIERLKLNIEYRRDEAEQIQSMYPEQGARDKAVAFANEIINLLKQYGYNIPE